MTTPRERELCAYQKELMTTVDALDGFLKSREVEMRIGLAALSYLLGTRAGRESSRLVLKGEILDMERLMQLTIDAYKASMQDGLVEEIKGLLKGGKK